MEDTILEVIMAEDVMLNDLMKYEVASELGLLDKVRTQGWKSLTAKESGRIGGIVARRKKAGKDKPNGDV